MKETIFDDEDHALATFEFIWSGGKGGYPPGGFAERLINCFIYADSDNLERLSLAYPAYRKAYDRLRGKA